MDTLLRNLKHPLRQVRRQPSLSAAIILTLALAIGTNTALLIRPFPFKDPGQFVGIHSIRGGPQGKALDARDSGLRFAYIPDGHFIAKGNQEASVHFWYRKSGKNLLMTGYMMKVRQLSWDTGGNEIV